MTERQKRFIESYLQTANAAESARRAGYSVKTAYSIGERLLRNADVQTAIKERLSGMDKRLVADTQEAMEHLTAVMRGKVKETIVTQSGKRFIVPVRESDRLRAAELILKVNGAFKDKLSVDVSGADLFVETLLRIAKEDDD